MESGTQSSPAQTSAAGGVVPRDDRSWPRGAVAISSVFLLVAFGIGLGLVVGAVGRGPIVMLAIAGGFLGTFCFAVPVFVAAMHHRIAGRRVPGRLQRVPLAGVLLGVVVLFAFDASVGVGMLAGLVGGLMVANLRAIRTARKNRDVVDAAEAAAARIESTATNDVDFASALPASDKPRGASVEQALRHACAVERRRLLAWLIAWAVAATACVVLDAPEALIGVVSIGGLMFAWVTRRLTAALFAQRDFAKAATVPSRAFVVLLHDPNPRAMRPLLGIWSQAPVARRGRLPRPERVYRCDDERDELECRQGDVVVHEAWVDTGPRHRSKPRWVASDTGIALPHRRSLFGRWYMSSLIGGERAGPPKRLTLPPPHPSSEVVGEADPREPSLLAALAGRLLALTVVAILFDWVA